MIHAERRPFRRLTLSILGTMEQPRPTMSSHHKRHSILPPIAQAGPKAPVRFSSTLTIADSAVLSGSHIIQIRSESVVHPRAKIESLSGSIDIGKRCVVHERTHIGAAGEHVRRHIETANAVTILDYCTIEVAATVEAGGTVIGEGTVVGVGSRIGSGAVIGRVGPDVQLGPPLDPLVF